MKKGRAEDTLEVVKRANEVTLERDEILGFVREAALIDAEEQDIEGFMILAMQLLEDGDKAYSLVFRMQALAQILVDARATGSTYGDLPDGATMTPEALLLAAAVEPVIERDGDVAFDRDSLLNRALELAELDDGASLSSGLGDE